MKKQNLNRAFRILLISALTLLMLAASFPAFAAENGIGNNAAQNIALSDAGAVMADRVRTEYEFEDGNYVYDVEFFFEGAEYEYRILAADGAILKKKTEYILWNAPENGTAVTEREAALLAVTEAGLESTFAALADTREDKENGRKEYKVMFRADGWRYEYEIDALTGFITEKSMELTAEAAGLQEFGSQYIGIDKAKAIALAHAKLDAGSVSFSKAKQDKEDGRVVYEIEFYYNGYEYEYEIDALTGSILDFDKDRD